MNEIKSYYFFGMKYYLNDLFSYRGKRANLLKYLNTCVKKLTVEYRTYCVTHEK